jgi:hypothetical protein
MDIDDAICTKTRHTCPTQDILHGRSHGERDLQDTLPRFL